MAFTSGEQGSGLLGRVFSAIGASKKPDIRHIPLSQEGDSAYSGLFQDYNKLLGNQTSGLADFTSAYKSLTPQLAGLDQLHASTYGDLLKRAQSYDPVANLRSSGDYLFGNIDKYLKTGMDAGNAALKQNLAAGGYGDRGPGGYSALLNANRVTANLLPLVGNAISNLTPLTNQQNSAYFQNIALQPELMRLQNASLEATPYRNLVPAGVEQDLLRGNLGTINDLVKGQLNNWAFYQKPNAWTTAGNVASGLYGGLYDAMDLANKAASTYGNLATSGLGGQMGFGGSTQPTQPQSNSIDINQLLSGLGGQGGGGAGGVNISQLMGLLNQFGVGQNRQPQTTYPSNLGLGSAEQYGYGSGENYGIPQSSIYGPVGMGGYSRYAPGSALGAYYNQNPYAQYGAYF